MENDIFTTPPISGEQVPYQDLPEQVIVNKTPEIDVKPETSPEEKKIKSLKSFMIILSIVILIIILILGLVLWQLKNKSNPIIVPVTTPTPQASQTPNENGLPQQVSDQVNQLEKDINDVDLKQLDLSYPSLDWAIKY